MSGRKRKRAPFTKAVAVNGSPAPAPAPATSSVAPSSASVTTPDAKAVQQKRMAVLAEVLSRAGLAGRMAGVQFGGNRDIYAAAGYVPQGKVKFSHYWGLYTRGDVAGRIVDMPAKTTWRTPPEIVEEGMDSTGTKFTNAFNDMAKRLRLWHYFQRVDRLAGIGRYAVLMIGVQGTTDQSLREPLERVSGAEDVVYLSVYNEENAQIQQFETDVSNPRFGLPRMYQLKVSGDQSAVRMPDLQVHASRVLHVADDLLEDDVYGRPRLERALNRLYDLDKVAASTGEAYWQMVARILQATIDPTVDVNEDQLKELDEKLGMMVHDLKRQFFGQGVKLEWLSSDTPNVQQVADFYFSLIAAAAGTPKRILFGSELGELASSTDQETYVGRINERQEQFAEPYILRAFIDRMLMIGALPEPETGDYQVVWPTLYEESDLEKADASLKRAQAAAALTPVGGNPRELITIDSDSVVWLAERTEPDEPADVVTLPDMTGIVPPPPPPNAPPPEGDITDVTAPAADPASHE